MKLKYHTPAGALYAPYLLDMIENNHVLIAGASGAGKSVLENSIIYALLCKKFPGDIDNGSNAKIILCDPKRVELDYYKNLPHVLYYADTITDIEKTLLRVREMIDSRLFEMKRKNQRKSNAAPVYVFIDELVDLFVSSQGKEIIRIISDCISISRATNIFFIMLTQAPNRKILRPEIILNCNCRVGLYCNSPIESRQIIGDDTAAALPIHGFAIVQQDTKRYKIKVPFYTDNEIENIVKFWCKQHSFLNRLFRPKL